MTAPFGDEQKQILQQKAEKELYKSYQKQYVDVQSLITNEGKLIPLVVYFDSDHKYEIDKILEMKKAASLKVGGTGIRYKVRICNKETYLFFDDGEFKFFVEAKT